MDVGWWKKTERHKLFPKFLQPIDLKYLVNDTLKLYHFHALWLPNKTFEEVVASV